jgi:hypothetical protein
MRIVYHILSLPLYIGVILNPVVNYPYMENTICQNCGKEFTPKRKTAKFCSAKCRKLAFRKKDSVPPVSVPKKRVSVPKNSKNVTHKSKSLLEKSLDATSTKDLEKIFGVSKQPKVPKDSPWYNAKNKDGPYVDPDLNLRLHPNGMTLGEYLDFFGEDFI